MQNSMLIVQLQVLAPNTYHPGPIIIYFLNSNHVGVRLLSGHLSRSFSNSTRHGLSPKKQLLGKTWDLADLPRICHLSKGPATNLAHILLKSDSTKKKKVQHS